MSDEGNRILVSGTNIDRDMLLCKEKWDTYEAPLDHRHLREGLTE